MARASESSAPAQPEGPAAAPSVADEPPDYATLDDDALASLYKKAADALDEGSLSASQREHLAAVGEHADDPHLRANAWLALGSWAQDAGKLDEAIGYFRRVVWILPEEAAGHAVLAMALAAGEKYDEAISAQEKLIEIDPDDLQAWLIWGELEVKAGHGEKAAKVYAGYEMRRKGLLDGLTLQKDGAYRLRPEDRVDCAVALAAAPDNGTALGLLYALSSDPDASVREAVVRSMGFQRFVGYLKPLEHHLTVELETSVKVATLEAIGAIRADPVETRPGVAPAGDAPAPPKAREGSAAPKGAPVAD
jgi:tetratricopeptide (TPR) repeat protein